MVAKDTWDNTTCNTSARQSIIAAQKAVRTTRRESGFAPTVIFFKVWARKEGSFFLGLCSAGESQGKGRMTLLIQLIRLPWLP